MSNGKEKERMCCDLMRTEYRTVGEVFIPTYQLSWSIVLPSQTSLSAASQAIFREAKAKPSKLVSVRSATRGDRAVLAPQARCEAGSLRGEISTGSAQFYS